MRPGRHGVVSTSVEGMATGKPAHGQPQSPYRPMRAKCLKGVLAAGRVEPADGGEEGANEAAVTNHGNDEEPCRQRRHGRIHRLLRGRYNRRPLPSAAQPGGTGARGNGGREPSVPGSCPPGCCRAHCWRAPTCRRSSRPRTRSRSAASSAWPTPAAAGCARNTSKQPSGSEATRPRISSRSRRFTRLRTTAEPTARLTTKPTFGLASSGTGPVASNR